MLLQAIVFDFDGVIADTEPIHLRAFQEELLALGFSLSERDYLDRYLGVSDREGFEAVSRDQGRPLDAAMVDLMIARKSVRMRAEAASASPVFPGVPDRVREWSQTVPVAIASGALRVEIPWRASRRQPRTSWPSRDSQRQPGALRPLILRVASPSKIRDGALRRRSGPACASSA
jgi:beta-phosphoglucomutase-like phosphatase (HAD superfamily)